MRALGNGFGFVEGGVVDIAPVITADVVAVGVVDIGGATGVGDRVGASFAAIGITADIGLVGNIAQQVVADGFGALASDLIVSNAV